MKWSDSLAIGVTKIDHQHQRLVKMVDQLEQALDRGEAAREMGGTIKALVDYTRYHFKDEEDFMDQIRFSQIEAHRKLHASLIEDVRRILLDIRGGKALTPADLIDFLRKWVVEHIEKEDLKIGAEMKRLRERSAKAGGHPAGAEEMPTHEMRTVLTKLKTLLERELIRTEDYAAKKSDLLQKYTRRFSPGSAVEITEEFAQLRLLAEEGLINAEDVQRCGAEMMERTDLAAILCGEGETEEGRFERLQGFLKDGVISQEAYDRCKAELLKRI